jgi:DNA repair exonuclease SbcCD ATPase subunit
MKAQKTAVVLGICATLAGLPVVATAQQSGQSLAEAARKAKEQQKQTPKAKVVWTNDNLPTSATVSVVGQPQQGSAASAAQAQPAEEAGTAPTSADASDLAKATAELTDAQKDVDSLKTDLDIAQREYKLDSDQYYGTPNYAADQQGQTKLDGEKSEIAAKQDALEAAQKKVDELQKKVDELNEKLKTTAAPTPNG